MILPNAATHREWGVWSDLINRYNLFENATTTEWAALLMKLQISRIWNPSDPSSLHMGEVHAVDDAAMAGGNYIILWQSTKCFFEQRGPTALPQRVGLINKEIDQLLQKFQERRIDDTTIYKDSRHARGSLGLPHNFEGMAPLNRTSSLDRASGDGHCCHNFTRCAERLNIIRTAQGSLRSVTSGVRIYVRFAAVLGRTPFPPTTDTVRAWSCIFKPGRTYQNYLFHREKACFLLDLDTNWDTPAIRTISHGLENSQGRSFAFPNFIFPSALLVHTHDGANLALFPGGLPFLPFLSLRAPSETLQLQRAFADDPITEFAPQTDKALIGIRTYKDCQLLVIKFAFRKNIRGGCVRFRPCIFFETDPRGRALCPIHAIWPLIRNRTAAGARLFPEITACSFNRALKAIMPKLGFAGG